MIQDYHPENLLALADYLEKLPEDYSHFQMSAYIEGGDETRWSVYALHNGGVAQTCGAVACAVGHGPAAGFLFEEGELREESMFDHETDKYIQVLRPEWSKYSDRVFLSCITYDQAYDFMFGGAWGSYDNTPAGAAKRIRIVVALGPKWFDEHKWFYSKDYSVFPVTV